MIFVELFVVEVNHLEIVIGRLRAASAFGPYMKRMIKRKALLDCIFLISDITRHPCEAELEP